MVANVEGRFATSSLPLVALKILDPLAVPETSELGFNVYRNRDIATLAQHFYQADNDASQKTRSSKLLAEWNQIKFNIKENIKPNIPIEIKTGTSNTTSCQWFLSHLMKSKSEYQPLFGELLLIAEAAITLPVSTAWPQRGASALKIVKNRCRRRLQNDMLEAMFHVKISGPALAKDGIKDGIPIETAVEKWLSKKIERTSQADNMPFSLPQKLPFLYTFQNR